MDAKQKKINIQSHKHENSPTLISLCIEANKKKITLSKQTKSRALEN